MSSASRRDPRRGLGLRRRRAEHRDHGRAEKGRVSTPGHGRCWCNRKATAAWGFLIAHERCKKGPQWRDDASWSPAVPASWARTCASGCSREGHEVVCLDNFFTGTRANVEHLLDNHRFELMRHDVTDPLTMEVDEIFHLACPASPIHYQRNPVRTIRTAVEGTLNMLDLAREAQARILIASTSEVYGDPIEHPQRESYWGNVNPIGPRACYDEGKRCAEALAVSYARQYGVEVRIARIFNTYGPRMHENDGRVVSNFVVQALRNEPITIYGEGEQTRSFCYATDLIEGFLRLMASPHGSDPGQPRQPARDDGARAGRDDPPAGRFEERAGEGAAAEGRSDAAQAGHRARAGAARRAGRRRCRSRRGWRRPSTTSGAASASRSRRRRGRTEGSGERRDRAGRARERGGRGRGGRRRRAGCARTGARAGAGAGRPASGGSSMIASS